VTVLEVIQRSTGFLAKKGIESPRLQVELLLAHTLKMPRLQLYLNYEKPLNPSDLDCLRERIKRRASHEPLQQITGSTSFCGFEIKVNRDVLVPRPETEVLAQCGWTFLERLSKETARPPRVLDFGTGSGCIAIALAAQSPTATITAVDISEAALNVARENAERNGVSERIHFFQGASLNELPSEANYDLIVSNPPYIPTAEIASLAPEVREFEPCCALDGGKDGLDFFRSLAHEAANRLRPEGHLMLECGDHQTDAVQQILTEAHWHVSAIEKDLSGRPRIVVAHRVNR